MEKRHRQVSQRAMTRMSIEALPQVGGPKMWWEFYENTIFGVFKFLTFRLGVLETVRLAFMPVRYQIRCWLVRNRT